MIITLAQFILSLLVGLSWAYEGKSNVPTFPEEKLPQLENVGITEHLGQKLDLSRTFMDENGQVVPLSTYFDGHRPVIFTLVYYTCKTLCSFHLQGLLDMFKKMDSPVGKDFQFVALSMNPRETPKDAAAKKATYLKELNQPGAEKSWHFLVGTEENIKAVAAEIGFQYKWIDNEDQFSHASAAYILTPNGTLSRYLYGIEFQPKTVRLSLVEASNGKIGTLAEHVLLYCFQFNPTKNKYTLYAFKAVQVGGALTVILLGIFLIPIWLRERKKNTLAG